MHSLLRHTIRLAVLAAPMLASCAGRTRAEAALSPDARFTLALPSGFADSVRTEAVAPNAVLHTIVNTRAPWRAYVVDMDLSCASVRALKGSATAVGRTTTSALLATLPLADKAFAAINADFFLFAPPGVPTNLHVEDRLVVAGPGPKPVFTFGDLKQFEIDTIVVRGTLVRGRADTVLQMNAWNRPEPRTTGIVTAAWGVPLDTLVRRHLWRLVPTPDNAGYGRLRDRGIVNGTHMLRRATLADTLAVGDTLVLHLDSTSARNARLRDGDIVTLNIGLYRRRDLFDPAVVRREGPWKASVDQAVGGRPIVLSDSIITRDADTEGNEGFRNLNPRTAVGLDRTNRRAWFAVIDGRQPGYSMGMTLRQVAELMQALGATHALNLDGGGSSALALRDLQTGTVRVVNRPSDKVERPVGNALALQAACVRM